eukprot:8465750-Alexandrium_andersonii.AAC.1
MDRWPLHHGHRAEDGQARQPRPQPLWPGRGRLQLRRGRRGCGRVAAPRRPLYARVAGEEGQLALALDRESLGGSG